jgi:cell division protein ZapE
MGAGSIRAHYEAESAAGRLSPDDAQRAAADAFDRLKAALEAYGGSKRRLFSFGRSAVDPPRGLYLHGSVGRGKTMLMDLFFASVRFSPKRRSHFHEFMSEVHDRIAVARKSSEGDPLPRVAGDIARASALLCFDELHVTDIADAMILGRLFKSLFAANVVMVATSNAMPEELYKNGLNRQLFLPFIDLIEERMEVVRLDAARDFRRDKLAGHPLYYTPLNLKARAEMDKHWRNFSGGVETGPGELVVKERVLVVPHAARGAARFAFADLCDRPLGAVDYLAIAHAFHTVLIDDVPILSAQRRDTARRFINLIDTLYDNHVGLIISAEAEPDKLYPAGDGSELFKRTASRLVEMRSTAYLERRKERAHTAALSG